MNRFVVVLPCLFVACLEPRSSPSESGVLDMSDTGSAPSVDVFESGSVDVSDNGSVPVPSVDAFDATGSVDVDSNPAPDFEVVVNEGPTVVPQTVVHLGAEGAPSDVTYRWSVTQPVGSVSVFRPSAQSASPTFELNVAGIYVFLLELLDGQGHVIAARSYTMVAVPVSELHVSLTWDTPGDPDQSDTGSEAGTDLDLHFLRTDLGGDWFDMIYDTFWYSPWPNAISVDPAVNLNPRLDRDDTDGAGPENINVTALSVGTFSIGVHYWADHGFGNSRATIRVYLHGMLIDEWAGVELTARDFWHSHVFDAETGTLSRVWVDGAPAIQSNYSNLQFQQP